MTQTKNTGTDPASGLEYYEAAGSTDLVDWKISGVEGDHATLDATISVTTISELDAAIAQLHDLRARLGLAETIRGEV